MAFDIVDEDNSGYLDASELAGMMADVAKGMGVNSPTEEDIQSILKNLDDDSDGKVDKREFLDLIMLVLGNVLEDED